jgi:hypothetical protein
MLDSKDKDVVFLKLSATFAFKIGSILTTDVTLITPKQERCGENSFQSEYYKLVD